jgi:hypothetical protein
VALRVIRAHLHILGSLPISLMRNSSQREPNYLRKLARDSFSQTNPVLTPN